MNHNSKRSFLKWLAAGLAAMSSHRAHSQANATTTWPSKPVRILVGFPAGSSPDLAARAVSDQLGRVLGQPVIIENKPGASGNIAADQVAKARDDHTIGILINGNLTVAKLLNPALPFDPARDFAPLSLLGTAPLVLCTAASAPAGTPAPLMQWLRDLGDKANYGTPGNGTVGHLGMELLKSKTGLLAQHVPFAGNPQVINALIGGQIHAALLPPGLAMPQVQGGKLKAIAVTSPVRSAFAPEVATLRDIGVTGIDLEIWTAFAGPVSLPRAVVDKLSAALVEVARMPDSRSRLLHAGWQTAGTAPEALVNRMKTDTQLLADIIRTRNIRLDS